MDVGTIKEKMQPEATAHGTVISMPTLEEAAWLVAEVERLTSERDRYKAALETIAMLATDTEPEE